MLKYRVASKIDDEKFMFFLPQKKCQDLNEKSSLSVLVRSLKVDHTMYACTQRRDDEPFIICN